ncbi:MAG: cobalamin biosynthesis protein CbiX [Betaproteobacteria bacterium]|nr:cobalamin biosynthesis protein CbiX [Betaproteobacteria bacterium]
MDDRTGLILFAHGSRDEAWREPFEAVLARVRKDHPGPVRLAFLERMVPSLGEAAAELCAEGVGRIVVVPLFLGVGGHVRDDLPRLASALSRELDVGVTVVAPAGGDPGVTAALARYAIDSIPGRGSSGG